MQREQQPLPADSSQVTPPPQPNPTLSLSRLLSSTPTHFSALPFRQPSAVLNHLSLELYLDIFLSWFSQVCLHSYTSVFRQHSHISVIGTVWCDTKCNTHFVSCVKIEKLVECLALYIIICQGYGR